MLKVYRQVESRFCEFPLVVVRIPLRASAMKFSSMRLASVGLGLTPSKGFMLLWIVDCLRERDDCFPAKKGYRLKIFFILGCFQCFDDLLDTSIHTSPAGRVRRLDRGCPGAKLQGVEERLVQIGDVTPTGLISGKTAVAPFPIPRPEIGKGLGSEVDSLSSARLIFCRLASYSG